MNSSVASRLCSSVAYTCTLEVRLGNKLGQKSFSGCQALTRDQSRCCDWLRWRILICRAKVVVETVYASYPFTSVVTMLFNKVSGYTLAQT